MPYDADNWNEVDSSHIEAIGTRGSDLIVKFKTGQAYLYPDLALEYPMLHQADSIGGYFRKHIREESCRRLMRTEE